MLSKEPLRSARRRWTCQASTARCWNPPRRPSLPVCRSYPHAVNSDRFTWCSWSTRKNSWSGPLQQRKTWYDGTWRQDAPTSNKTSWSRDTLLSQHRRHCVAPRQTLLDQTEEFPPLLGHCGGRTTTFWSHFVVHVGAGRAKLPHVVEETELLLMSAVADHLLSLRVDLSNWTPSQGDGIQGAEMKTVLCGIGSLQGCYVRKPLLLKMAQKFSRDQRVRDRTTIGEWHRNNTEWVRHIHEWMHRRVAPLADAFILEPNSAACTIRPHTRRACILMQAETDVAMRQSTRFNPLVI